VHVGGRFALARHGHEHYLRLGESATLTLYGPAKLPAWAGKLPLRERVQACGKGPFDWPRSPSALTRLTRHLNAQGLERATDDTSAAGVVFFHSRASNTRTVRRDGRQRAGSRGERADAGTRDAPAAARQRNLLQHCDSIKAKRLFLALADRHRHAWFTHV
jgi:hypothetical protein